MAISLTSWGQMVFPQVYKSCHCISCIKNHLVTDGQEKCTGGLCEQHEAKNKKIKTQMEPQWLLQNESGGEISRAVTGGWVCLCHLKSKAGTPDNIIRNMS